MNILNFLKRNKRVALSLVLGEILSLSAATDHYINNLTIKGPVTIKKIPIIEMKTKSAPKEKKVQKRQEKLIKEIPDEPVNNEDEFALIKIKGMIEDMLKNLSKLKKKFEHLNDDGSSNSKDYRLAAKKFYNFSKRYQIIIDVVESLNLDDYKKKIIVSYCQREMKKVHQIGDSYQIQYIIITRIIKNNRLSFKR